MWRTVIVNRGERITLSQNRLVVYCDALEQKIPLGDIYALVLENGAASVSVSVLAALAKVGAHVYFCDKQYNAIEIVVGKRLEEEDLLDTKDIIEL